MDKQKKFVEEITSMMLILQSAIQMLLKRQSLLNIQVSEDV